MVTDFLLQKQFKKLRFENTAKFKKGLNVITK